jgi:methionyl-tRNA synthetase
MPFTSPKILKQLGLPVPETFSLQDAQCWGVFADGTMIGKGEPIFPRIELTEPTAAAPQPPAEEEISIEDFNKVKLRVARVIAAEKVEKTDKLLKLTLEAAGEERTVVSGIAQHYQPEELIGKHLIVVANLKPAKLRGIESRGMILAASDENNQLLVVEAPGIKTGSRVK